MKLLAIEDYPHPVPEGLDESLWGVQNFHEFVCPDRCDKWPYAVLMLDDRVKELLEKNYLIFEEARHYVVRKYSPLEIYEGFFDDPLMNAMNLWTHFHMFLKFSERFHMVTFDEAVKKLKDTERRCPVPLIGRAEHWPKIKYVTDIDELSDVER